MRGFVVPVQAAGPQDFLDRSQQIAVVVALVGDHARLHAGTMKDAVHHVIAVCAPFIKRDDEQGAAREARIVEQRLESPLQPCVRRRHIAVVTIIESVRDVHRELRQRARRDVGIELRRVHEV